MSLRVLHVDPERGWGGGEVQVLGLLRELAVRGHEVRLAADPGGQLFRHASAAGVPVHPLPIRNHLDLRAALRLRRLTAKADIVHFHTARAHALAPFVSGPSLRRIVTRRMDYVPRGGPYARLLYNRAVDAVIAISQAVARALEAGGVDPGRIRVVPSGVDPATLVAAPGAAAACREAWGIAPGTIVILLLGALEERKGHRILLEAAHHLPEDVRFVFCGSGSLEHALRAEAAQLKDRIVFAGFRSDVGACLAAADVVVLPSRHEGLGVAALEAMAVGRPVVASRVGGLGEVVVDGTTGRLVPPGDPCALADALRPLVASPTMRRAFGDAGRRVVDARFTLARMAEGTLACYEKGP